MPDEERTTPNGSLFAPRGARCPRIPGGGSRDGRPRRDPRPGSRPADPPRGRGSVPRTVRALLPERDVARAPRRTTTVPRGGDRAGSVLGGLAEPGRLRPAARVGPRVVDGHGPSPRRRRRAPRGVPAPAAGGGPATRDDGVTALGPRDRARPGRGHRRRDRTPGGTPGRPRRPRRSPRRTASGDRAHVLRRPVAVADLGER